MPVSLMTILTAAWSYLLRGGSALWASIAALLASPAVWLACSAIFAGGFTLGHWERNHAVKALRADLNEATSEKEGLETQMAQAAEKLKAALAEAARFKAAYEAAVAGSPPAGSPAPAKGKKKESKR